MDSFMTAAGARIAKALNFPVIGRDFADAMRTNRRADALTMQPVDWNPERIPARALVEQKHDGIRATFRHDIGAASREGVDLGGMMRHLLLPCAAAAQQLHMLTGKPHLLDGEYVNPDGFEATLADMQRGAGTGVFMIFDAIPLDAYEGREASLPLTQRKMALGTVLQTMHRSGLYGVAGSLFEGAARDSIELAAGSLSEAGHEGIVVKDADSPYIRGSSPLWQRIKRHGTIDLPICGIDLHDDGTMRAIRVRLASGRDCAVGVGFTAEQRAAAPLVTFRTGRMVEINHRGFTGKGALRSASFSRFRDDKGA